MQKRFLISAFFPALVLALFACGLGLAATELTAQTPLLASPAPKAGRHGKQAIQAHASADPAFSIPVTPLGFASPAPFYLGSRVAQLSLDFLDEDHLLFTFRVPGLIQREQPMPGHEPEDERHVRALVLSLPEGRVVAEALWTLHDAAPYLWMLKDRHFLLRDRNGVQMGDSALHIEPFLRFPGPVKYLELDAEQKYLIASTLEPPAPETTVASTSASGSNQAILPDSSLNKGSDPAPPQSILRILRMDTRSVMLFSRVAGFAPLPVDSDGYYEALRGKANNWVITHQGFRGDTINLLQLDSTCSPALDAVAPGLVLASACLANGARKITAITQNPVPEKRHLWDIQMPPMRVWPRIRVAAAAGRFARSAIEATHQVDTINPLSGEEMRSQSVQVYDLADGKLQLTAPASPVLDGGGNFALSPSGRSFAVLHAGAIEVFHLPPAAALPETLPPPEKPSEQKSH